MTDHPRSWSFVWLLAAAQLVAWGCLYYAFAVAVVPMETELGWSRTSLNGALSVGLLTWGLAAPVVGRWIDRHGARAVMSGGAVAGGLLMVAWSQVGHVWVFTLIWAGLGVSMACLLYEPVFAVVTALFRSDYRRAITAITLLGGFASTVLIPATQMLCDHVGWRWALLILGLVCAVFVGGIHWALLRPGDGRSLSASRRTGAKVPLSSPVFLGLAVWFTAYGAIFTGLTFQLIPLMTTHGLDSGRIITVMALIGPMQVAGRVALLGLGRRVDARRTGAFVVTTLAAAVTILLAAPDSFPALVVFALLYGTANGIVTIVRGTAVPEYLPGASYASTNGVLALPVNLAKAGAPLALAALWSATGEPRSVVVAILGCCGLAAAGYVTATVFAARRHRDG